MLPPNFEPPVPGFQVGELVIDGLAICCFNNGSSNGGSKLWEVAYPRQQGHTLSIIVEELDDQGEPTVGDPRTYVVEDKDEVRSFTISLTGGSEAHYEVYPRGGPAAPKFVRTAPNNDPHDLGWMIDITGPELQHNFIRLLPKAESNVDVTLAQFRHAFFYTSQPGDQPARLSPVVDDDPLSANSRPLGRTNQEIEGLLLANKAGEIRFEFDPPRSFSIDPLPYDLNRPLRYRISILNEDDQPRDRNGGFTKGDLHLFYNVIEVGGVKKDLWTRPIPAGPGSPSDGDCQPVGASSVTTLQPLT